MKATVTEQTLRDLLDTVGLLIAGLDMIAVEDKIASLRVELDGEPKKETVRPSESAIIYQFPQIKR